jgi:nucleotidyltransferase/DNA polymerase involved in DNA repair
MMRLTPLVEPLSIDEALLDLSDTQVLHGAFPAQLLARLARRVEDALAIAVSTGLSDNKFLAKLASDLDKPRGSPVSRTARTTASLMRMPRRIRSRRKTHWRKTKPTRMRWRTRFGRSASGSRRSLEAGFACRPDRHSEA